MQTHTSIRNHTIDIQRETLRAWLEYGHPVEIIDIRPQADYQEWHIPGSRNIDAYQSLFADNPGPLAHYSAPDDTPVVVVCFVGYTSGKAAHYLRTRGIPALSLAGGMQAWSLAWNAAEIPLKQRDVRVIQVRRTGKGCLSYLVGSAGEALVIDPSVEPQVYRELAMRHGWHITHVLDTHIHADHLSRGRALAADVGGTYCLPQQERATFAHTSIASGGLFRVGYTQLQALHTPGHTFESMSFLLGDEAVFTGDTLFLNSVGRPDLKADQAESAARARSLYDTLQQLVRLDPAMLVLPSHTSQPVPFDQVPIVAPLSSVIERVAALGYDQETFVTWVLEHLPPHPPNYERIVQHNEAGILPDSNPAQVEAGANRCAV